MNSNEFEGAAKEIKGRVKDGIGGLTGDTGTQAEGKVDELAGKAQRKMGDVADAASDALHDASDKAGDYASRASATLRDAADTVRQEAQAAGSAMYDAGAKAGVVVGDTVKEYPLLSLIGVAAIGYLAAFLVHAPSSPLTPPVPRYRRDI